MPDSYDLTKLDPHTFEHLVNLVAIQVLGAGHTGFGPGSDGGRDGYFEGEAPYPSTTHRWSGVWYIQSKFHRPHLSADPQRWLLDRIKEEIEEFKKPGTSRVWPDNWIIATNIDPSGRPQTGAFDRARTLVRQARPQLAQHFHLWGGAKILSYLVIHPEVARYYGEFLTPGQVLSAFFQGITDAQAGVNEIFRHLVVSQFTEQQFTKLEQAGSTTDNRPGIHRLFTDLPFLAPQSRSDGMAAATLARASAQNHRITKLVPALPMWRAWQRLPSRARVWFIKGGPGQGKSTLGQYICQIQRAVLILDPNGPVVVPNQIQIAQEIKDVATESDLWPLAPRIPVYTELKDFAQWFGLRSVGEARGVLTYLAHVIGAGLGQAVHPGTLKRAFGTSKWLFAFDGLDEVPGDVKDEVAREVTAFIDDVLVGCSSDALSICTSRPQGYSGQFAGLDAAGIELSKLSPQQALACAKPVLQIDRSPEESKGYFEILQEALQSPAIREIMTTPLQAHIMAVVVRDGGRPPERKWQLFTNFYQVIKKREANKKSPDRRLARLLRESEKLLKNLHNRLGFELHERAETSAGAQTSLNRDELSVIVRQVVSELQDRDVDETVSILLEATTERLVLVSTPETGEAVRFDIRPLQEFFAAEYIYESAQGDVFLERLRLIAGDSHWREVIHFILSALIENDRKSELATAVQALIDLNEGTEGSDHRLLKRRLALGGVTTARLLEEGVLEQDKRIRQQFHRCLDPLFGCTDAPAYLYKVAPPHSLSWLCNVLLDDLLEKTESENIGAAAALATLLDDNHPRLPSLKEFLNGSSPAYRSAFLATTSHLRGDPPARRPRWLLNFALSCLLRPDWPTLGAEGISNARGLLT